MHRFLEAVQKAMVDRGWSAAAAEVQIDVDPGYLLELQAEGMSAIEVADEVERQYQSRHSSAA